jgi:hypothetical protein
MCGALTGLILILAFTGNVTDPDPAWGVYWKVRPLIVTPLVGAVGAGIAYYTYWLLQKFHWSRVLTLIVCAFGFIVSIWLGIVLGLDGTLWN